MVQEGPSLTEGHLPTQSRGSRELRQCVCLLEATPVPTSPTAHPWLSRKPVRFRRATRVPREDSEARRHGPPCVSANTATSRVQASSPRLHSRTPEAAVGVSQDSSPTTLEIPFIISTRRCGFLEDF